MSPRTLAHYTGVSNRTLIDRLVRCYQRATPEQRADGLAWYGTMHKWCSDLADDTDRSVETVVGVLAALSPQCPVKTNQGWTTASCLAGIGLGNVGMHRNKATAILRGADLSVLGTRKVRHFAQCVLDPWSDHGSVAVDRWAIRAMGIPEWKYKPIAENDYRYDEAVSIYRRAAARVGVLAHELQAVTWVATRGKAW